MGTSSKQIWVTSLYGAQTRQPIVSLAIQDTSVQMDVDKAREIGLMLLEAAEGAESDAFIHEFCEVNLDQDTQTAKVILSEFRKWRDQKRAERKAQHL